MTKPFKNLYKRVNHWVRYCPPHALSSKGWRLFNREFKEKAPIRYYITHNFSRQFILPIKWKYESIRDWLRFRTYDRYHIVSTGLAPGYHDVSSQIFHINFNLLRIFVEEEQAWQTYWWSDECRNASKFVQFVENHVPFYWNFKKFNKPEMGIKHFEWASTLDDPNLPPHEQSPTQAKSAREILTLYKWWVTERPGRTELAFIDYSNQGLGEFGCFDDDFDFSAQDYRKHTEYLKKQSEQQELWDAEDQIMLERLIKIRDSLWT